MIYTVVWQHRAQTMLAQLWNQAADRAAIAKAADAIDGLLRVDAPSRGEARSGRFRVLFEPPLAVHFQVDELDRMVKVLNVWRVRF
jgi:hypothetical protein